MNAVNMPGSGATERIDNAATGSGTSAASWAAIIAGSFVAAATSIILITLGAGIGFAANSASHSTGSVLSGLTEGTVIWLIVTQWMSAFLGGYIAGRLRTRWIGTHTHEVFFRDTAHGLITWAVATVAVAGLLGSSVLAGLHGGATLISRATGAAAPDSTATGTMVGSAAADAYGTDLLFRPVYGNDVPPATLEARSEASRILANALIVGNISPADRDYLAGRVAASTGASTQEAQARVADFYSSAQAAKVNAKLAADEVRNAAAHACLYTALSLLIGAFIASVSAALGGRLRDQHP